MAESATPTPAFTHYQPGFLASGRGPLNGCRLGVKDLFDIAGLPTTAGNPDWLASHDTPTETHVAITTLVNAGARFIGKTLTDELAYSLNGVNKHYGTPCNPVTPERLPGGSSSGSAVAVANHDIDVGLGTDTGGSIRIPASYNGLYGLRPTHGEISTQHMVALAPRFDTVGWLTRTAGLLREVGDYLLADMPAPTHPIEPTLVIPKSVWSAVSYTPLLHQQLKLWKRHWQVLEVPGPDQEQLAQCSSAFRTLQGAQIWQQHGKWFTEHTPDLATDIKQRLQWCSTLTAQDVEAAEHVVEQCRQWFSPLFPHAKAVVLWPTTPGSAPLLDAAADTLSTFRNQLMSLTAPAGLLGLPQLHMPLGRAADGGTVGISLLGQAKQDRLLLELAVRMEALR